ncbi:MAG: flagellar basal body rod protein FlgB [Lachnospiraceae bacterium]|nr:flagellar basal body rod protein FlgB [Lachnospiraceae bacterium]
MIRSNAFDYINVLDKAADASWLRNDAIANNLANVSTPGYKREDITFEKELTKALKHSDYHTMDAKVKHLTTDQLQARTYKDYSSLSYRLDGNNVDPETESVMLAKNQIKYEGLLNSINSEFANLRSVMK